MSKKARRILIVCMAAVVACAVGARIFVVNATAVQLPEEHYAMNQWVDLDGAFLVKSLENTQDYSVKVKSAQLMSYNDYIKEFGTDKTHTKAGFDTKSVLDLEVEIKNAGGDEGSFNIFSADLVPARKNNYLIFDRLLWHESEPQQDVNALMVRIKGGSDYTTNIPYQMNIGNPGNDEQPQPALNDTSFELILSNDPVRKIVDIDVGSS